MLDAAGGSPSIRREVPSWWACAEGVVARVDEDARVTTIDVGHELRDVVSVGPPLLVSTFRDATVLTVAADGTVIDKTRPASSNTARRTIPASDGGWHMLHQVGAPERLAENSEIVQSSGWATNQCNPIQEGVISTWTPGSDPSSFATGYAVVFDADVRGKTAAVAGFSQGFWTATIFDQTTSHTVVNGCPPGRIVPTDGTPTAIALTANGAAWVLTREPAALGRISGPDAHRVTDSVPLSDRSVEDTGHELFHTPTQLGAACVSCHPEGRDDGLQWQLASREPRRTQPLDVPLEGTEPFHWDGAMADLHQVADEVFQQSMGGRLLDRTSEDALERWIFSLADRRLDVRPDDPEAVSRGQQLFEELACNSCHAGPRFTNNATTPIGDGAPLQVPGLIGVRWRAPYLHDGSAEDLDAAVEAMPLPRPATASEVADIAAYLRSL